MLFPVLDTFFDRPIKKRFPATLENSHCPKSLNFTSVRLCLAMSQEGIRTVLVCEIIAMPDNTPTDLHRLFVTIEEFNYALVPHHELNLFDGFPLVANLALVVERQQIRPARNRLNTDLSSGKERAQETCGPGVSAAVQQ